MKARSQGILSKHVVSKPVRSGPGARAINVKWPAQVGISRGNRVQGGAEGGGGHTVPLSNIRAEPYKGRSYNPIPQGNQVAASTQCRPGGSRVIHPAGGQHGLRSPPSRPRARAID
jgi:hypothetical protein